MWENQRQGILTPAASCGEIDWKSSIQITIGRRANVSDSDLIQGLEELFRETGQAHHQAFLSTDGADPELPIWYAAYLMDRIGELQKVEFTKSELVYLLVLVSKEQAVKDPGADWTEYYARFFAERCG